MNQSIEELKNQLAVASANHEALVGAHSTARRKHQEAREHETLITNLAEAGAANGKEATAARHDAEAARLLLARCEEAELKASAEVQRITDAFADARFEQVWARQAETREEYRAALASMLAVADQFEKANTRLWSILRRAESEFSNTAVSRDGRAVATAAGLGPVWHSEFILRAPRSLESLHTNAVDGLREQPGGSTSICSKKMTRFACGWWLHWNSMRRRGRVRSKTPTRRRWARRPHHRERAVLCDR